MNTTAAAVIVWSSASQEAITFGATRTGAKEVHHQRHAVHKGMRAIPNESGAMQLATDGHRPEGLTIYRLHAPIAAAAVTCY
ncbi:predicted protein [Histoplasma mississippiense (nom. inval.)]|uniref:predicted protein n=1 Tax=Ajellomyces capsulatus (strain NAm1 / WU24) TaxID=2059318 RepID=UPI000157CF1C|nr:predicted protein [Histoplasma mississippiense (nom. inval.)]EDN11167.1 predicted protein [Histoplasma mississippiense (nom. inval.)]